MEFPHTNYWLIGDNLLHGRQYTRLRKKCKLVNERCPFCNRSRPGLEVKAAYQEVCQSINIIQ